MDENPEVNMDTDVSSTTADVPETQEVTGSNGQVEMVIVVEKLNEEKEEEMSSSHEKIDNEVEPSSICTTDDTIPNVDTQDICEVRKSPVVVSESNNKSSTIKEIQDVTLTVDPDEKTHEQVTTSETLPTGQIQNEELVDSSNKPPLPTDIENNLTEAVEISEAVPEKKSPVKSLDMEELQTTFIEISERLDEIITNKKEEAPPVSLNICEKSNDSQFDPVLDLSEKEQNKSISRELKSLIKSAKESKIINECTQLTSKTRKSRIGLDASSGSLNTSMEAEKLSGRRNSNNSQLSNTSEQSEKVLIKRSMRSQNPEFVHKVKQFLNSVTGKHKVESDDEVSEELTRVRNETGSPYSKKKKQNESQEEVLNKVAKLRTDPYCWRCHWQVEQSANEKGHSPLHCTVCPRAFHYKCLSSAEKTKIDIEKSWVCPECLAVLHAESSETRSPSMKKISLGLLRELLQHALQRMMELNGVEQFMNPVNRTEFPDYDKYVVHPMDLKQMKSNVTEGLYGSTEAFAADAQWILHNSIIFNTVHAKLTGNARALVRTCRAEMGEIEACPECYAAAHARKPTWFTDVCSTPHILLWAKLKGFPYWPAKGMSLNNSGMVDVRFFGAHDRAWVPARDCFLYSEKDPNNFRTKRQDILDSMQEAEHHIRNISRKYGKFVYPSFKTQFDPTKLNEQLKAMIPAFEGEIKSNVKEKANSNSPIAPKSKGRSNSKSSKSSFNDGDMSENEETITVTSRKMADGVEIAREEEDYAVEKDKTMEVATPKKDDDARKRRQSVFLEEAVITIMDNSFSSKKRRVDNEAKDDKNESLNKSKTDNKDGSKENTKTKKVDTPNTREGKKAETPTMNKEDKEAHSPVIKVTTPLRSVFKTRPTKTSTPKEKEVKNSTLKQKKLDKSIPDKSKKVKRRSSKIKINLNNHTVKGEGNEQNETVDNLSNVKEKNDTLEVSTKPKPDESKPKRSKRFDDNTSLAVIARESKTNGLPTISSVRSLSTTAPTSNTNSKTTTNAKCLEVTIEANTSSSNVVVRNAKDTTEQPAFGRVGVRAFARMTSPEKPKDVEVEIKAEPMDFDDADRQVEKIDMMNMFQLRPVNPPAVQKLRDIRINKVVVPVPIPRNPAPKPPESRLKARKSFPQPRKPDDSRSELNGKNSMVYIPIQPPTTQAPMRPTRPVTINANTQCLRPPMATATSGANKILNALPNPLMPMMVTSSSANNPAAAAAGAAMAAKTSASLPCVPPVGQTTVHTVPYITSVNGQCYFSLQPIMSVGGVDNQPPGVVNELPDRTAVLAAPPVPVPVPAPAVPTVVPNVVPTVVPATMPPGVTTVNGTGSSDTVGELPRLQQRPSYLNPLDASAASAAIPAPASAGPLTAKLNQNASKLTDFFRTLLEDTLERVEEPASQVTSLKLQLEQMQWKHQQEIKELKHNHDLTVSEMRASFEKEKARAVSEVWRSARSETDAAVKAAKAKQWCAYCKQEAQFYCCWNTSYCDYPCQRAHWNQHFAVCTQERNQDSSNGSCTNSLDKRLQPAPDNIPKSAATPTMTVGGKVSTPRDSGKEQQSPQGKSTIIVNVDKAGAPSVKCVGGPFKGTQQMSPLIINKQIMSSEEGGAKKVVTSGGYLIVGSGTSAPLATPRRTQTIHYYQ